MVYISLCARITPAAPGDTHLSPNNYFAKKLWEHIANMRQISGVRVMFLNRSEFSDQ